MGLLKYIKGSIMSFFNKNNIKILNKTMYEIECKKKSYLEKFHGIVVSKYNQAYLKNGSIDCIIFSMDRAIQLHALLNTFMEKVKNYSNIFILYMASSEEHQKAYNSLIAEFKGKSVFFVKQQSRKTFKSQLIELLKKVNERLFFLVDDILFTEEFDINSIKNIDPISGIFSLRLGKNLKRCYTLQKEQCLPEFAIDSSNPEFIQWSWKNGEYDWNYPLSVDGNIFLREEILAMTEIIDFHSPNSFEANLQIFKPYFTERAGYCLEKSPTVNLPINRVQNDIDNVHGSIDPEYLLKKWNEGLAINYKKIYGFVNESAHQEIEISFTKR